MCNTRVFVSPVRRRRPSMLSMQPRSPSTTAGAPLAAMFAHFSSTIAVEISKVALEAMFLQAPDLFDRLGALLADRQRRLGEPQAAPGRASEIIDAMKRLFGRPSLSH